MAIWRSLAVSDPFEGLGKESQFFLKCGGLVAIVGCYKIFDFAEQPVIRGGGRQAGQFAVRRVK